VAKVAGNIVNTFVAHPLRNAIQGFADPTHGGLGYAHDFFFLIYQHNLLAAIGLVGGLAAVHVIWRTGRELRARRRTGAPLGGRLAERRVFFWIVVGGGLVVGIGSVGILDAFGVTHVSLQPVVLLGLVAIASSWRTLSRRWREAVLGGAIVDYLVGILLHFVAQSANPELRTLAGLPRRLWRPLLDLFASASALRNASPKLARDLVFLGDLTATLLWLLFLAIAGATAWVVVILSRHTHGDAAASPR
jgi:hypothetical protein